ncbi:MAG: carbohydrate-binding domain-containing protein [Candidatus Woesearchaeota archaeon]
MGVIETAIDVVFVIIILGLLVGLAFSIRNKPEFGYTEIYFDNHTLLPEIMEDTTSFSFSVHNVEHKDKNYTAQVIAEVYGFSDGKTVNFANLTLDTFQFFVPDGGRATFNRQYSLNREYSMAYNINDTDTETSNDSGINDNGIKYIPLLNKPLSTTITKARIKIIIDQKEISFWIRNPELILNYEGLGNGTVECIDVVNYVDVLSRIAITANATYGGGWPKMIVYLDGKNVSEFEVVGSGRYEVVLNATSGVHYIDIVYPNDYYNSTTEEDRNLYIQHVFKGGVLLKPSVYDSGKGVMAFDCANLKTGLLSSGSARYKVIAAAGEPK